MSPTRIRAIAAAALLLGILFVIQTIRWSGETGAERAHRKFLEHVADRRWGKCHRMISSSYSDRWDFNRDDLSLALQDVGGQFVIHLEIDWETGRLEKTGDGYEVEGTMTIDGRGGPAVGLILKEARPYCAHPFTFRWRREGLLPWRWKLQSIDHPTLEVPSGYVPGDLGSLTYPF